MTKIKSLADLRKLKDEVQSKIKLREKGDNPENLIHIKVSMATCGIASGAKETMNFLIEELDHQGIDAIVTQTGCMGYCYAEPTIEVTIPRITSYNVCYTKLLRLLFIAIILVPRLRENFGFKISKCVITSYSIHYTKLYES